MKNFAKILLLFLVCAHTSAFGQPMGLQVGPQANSMFLNKKALKTNISPVYVFDFLYIKPNKYHNFITFSAAYNKKTGYISEGNTFQFNTFSFYINYRKYFLKGHRPGLCRLGLGISKVFYPYYLIAPKFEYLILRQNNSQLNIKQQRITVNPVIGIGAVFADSRKFKLYAEYKFEPGIFAIQRTDGGKLRSYSNSIVAGVRYFFL